MDKRKALLLKLKTLAERGEGGEKINAEEALKRLMVRYGYTVEELESEEKIECTFRYRTKRERQLLFQIIYKVTNVRDVSFFKRGNEQNKARSFLTIEQQMEVELLFDFYKKLYAKEEQSLFSAFVHKHRIFRELMDDEEPMEISSEERRKLARIASGLDDATPYRQIEVSKWGGV